MGPDREAVQADALSMAQKSNRFFSAILDESMPYPVADRLLRTCGVVRLNFLSRVGLLGEYSQAFTYFDRRTAQASDHISSGPDSPASPGSRRQQAAPIRHAGFAYRSYSNAIAPAAALGSFAMSALHISRVCPNGLPPAFGQSVANTVALIRPTLDPDLADCLLPPLATSDANGCFDFYRSDIGRQAAVKLQGEITRNADLYDLGEVLADSSPLDGARLLACTAPYASSWLCDPFPESPMSDAAHAAASRMRTGQALSSNQPTTCHCGADLTLDPWHVLAHKGSFWSNHRHNEVRDAIADWVRKAGGRVWVEAQQDTWHDRRRPDLRVALGGKIYLIDVVVSHPTAQSNLRFAVAARLGCAAHAAKLKVAKYSALARAEGAEFIPFSIETYVVSATRHAASCRRLVRTRPHTRASGPRRSSCDGFVLTSTMSPSAAT